MPVRLIDADDIGTALRTEIAGTSGLPFVSNGSGTNPTFRPTTACWTIPFDGGAVVQDGRYLLTYFSPLIRTITSVDFATLSGSFTIELDINGVAVVWTGNVTTLDVTSSTSINLTALSHNIISLGSKVELVITNSSSSPTNSFINIRLN